MNVEIAFVFEYSHVCYAKDYMQSLYFTLKILSYDIIIILYDIISILYNNYIGQYNKYTSFVRRLTQDLLKRK